MSRSVTGVRRLVDRFFCRAAVTAACACLALSAVLAPVAPASATPSISEASPAELAFAVLPPADLGATLPPGPLFELALEAETPVASSGLASSRQLPLSAGDTEGQSLAGELDGLAIPIQAAGWLFADGFESGAVDRWSASMP